MSGIKCRKCGTTLTSSAAKGELRKGLINWLSGLAEDVVAGMKNTVSSGAESGSGERNLVERWFVTIGNHE
jgi:hypothetical protein